MNNLTIITHNGIHVVDSREVAVMVMKQHKDLLDSIRSYEQFLLSGDFRSVDFFIPGTYQDPTGRTLPCYFLTRKGCDMVANKMTGEKGVLFTAAYVTKFEEMEKALQPKPISQIEALLQSVQLLAEQERQIKQLTESQAQQTKQLTVLNERISNLDLLDIDGDLQQRLNSMIRKVARDRGIPYSTAWREFIQDYNTAYRTNLTASKNYYEEKRGKSFTTPGYLNEVGRLEDAIRVADKMLNKAC